MMRGLLALLMLPSFAMAQSQPLTLEALEQIALQRHPELAAAAARVESARAEAEQAGAWSNPTIGYVGDEIAGGKINRGGEHGVFVTQTIPLGGRLRVSREALEAGAAVEAARQARARAMVLTRVRIAYYEAVAAQQRVDVRERLQRLAGEALATSKQLFNVGLADRPDVLGSEIAASMSALDLEDARRALARAWQSLQAAAGDRALPQQPLASGDDPLPAQARDAALAAALAASPELAEARAAAIQAEREVDVAGHAVSPELVLNGGPRYNRELLEPDLKPVGLEWSVEAGVTLPLFNRNAQGRTAATSRLAAARQDVAAVELRLTAEFARLFETFSSARHRAETYRTEILPRAEEAYRLYLERFKEMGAEYTQVLMAQRALFEASDRQVDALEAARVAAALLKALVTDIP